MKKWSLIFVSFLSLLVLVACGARGGEISSSASSAASSRKGDKVLVVYLSMSGNTQSVAQEIADTTGGDLFQLEPDPSFTSEDLNWTNRDSRVVREYENEEQRTRTLANPTPDNWDDYDTIFVGYPLWWQQAPWPMEQFFTQNDFSGKTVIPFVTSTSSPIGTSAQNAEKLAGSGDWQEGRRFSQSDNSSEVVDWLKELGY